MNSKTANKSQTTCHLQSWFVIFCLTALAGCSEQAVDDNAIVGDPVARQPDNVQADTTPLSSTQVVYGKQIQSVLEANVTKVLDGDTIEVKTDDDQHLTVRMESIDAPEGNARYADLVFQKVTALLQGKDVELLTTGQDGRGRTLAFVVIDGTNMNAKLIELGLVEHFKRYSNSQELAELEIRAREQNLNIWSVDEPAADGEAVKLKSPLSLLFWNVESGGADAPTIAAQLGELAGHTIYGLCEVPGSAFEVYQTALGNDFKSIRGTHFKEDHLQLIFDDRQLQLLSWNEVDEVGDIRMNNLTRSHRSPLLARFKQRDGGAEFYVMVNHLARGDEDFRQNQAAGLREWARNRQMPILAIGDYNFDYVFATDRGNRAFSEFLQDNIWKWIRPVEMIDTNWYDEDADGNDDYPGSMLDFMFVAGSAKQQQWKCEVIVRDGDFPDDERTSDHRPVVLTLQADAGE